VSTTATSDRFTTLPDEKTLAETVVALEKHGFSVEIADDLPAAREAVLARIPHGSTVMTNTSMTLTEAGIDIAINHGGPYKSARNEMFALDFATQAPEMKAISGQPDYALGSVHAITEAGMLVIASASGSQFASLAWGAANVIFVVGALAPPGAGVRAFHRRRYRAAAGDPPPGHGGGPGARGYRRAHARARRRGRDVRAEFLAWAGTVNQQAVYDVLASQRDLDLSGDLGRLTQPVVVVHGRHDRARPAEQGRELAASLPAAEFRLVQEAGHTPVYETPEVVAAAVRDVLARI
jgi:pimeloyl-ACP methyl ester carboxylesterase